MMKHKQHFAVLDGLRGLAAIYVAFHHLNSYGHGYLAVDFFFMLSGFVIAFSYENPLMNGTMTFSQFLLRRFIRLYPLIVAGALLGFMAYFMRNLVQHDQAGSTAEFLKTAAKGLFLIPVLNPVPVGEENEIFPFNSPQWSLFFEIFFNILYALAIRFLNWRALVGVFAVSLCILITLVAQHHNISFGFLCDNFWYGFPRTAVPMTAGVIIFRLYHNKKLPAVSCPLTLLALSFLLLLAIPKFHSEGDAFYDLACVLVVFPTIIALGIHIKPQGKILKLCKLSGELSYPLYVLHTPVEMLTRGVGKALSIDVMTARFFIPILFACLVAAYISLKLYDEPVRRWLTKKV